MLYKKTVNGVEFTAVCESWNKYNSWGHIVTIYKNGVKVASSRIRYYNRTWESYQYQSAILSAISNLINDLTGYLKDAFKRVNNYVVLTAKRKIEFAEYCKQDQDLQNALQLYKMF